MNGATNPMAAAGAADAAPSPLELEAACLASAAVTSAAHRRE